ncbi:helix-turn-helix domain-containing protein [Citrobacter portucalensis]|jgi:transcriptional regulator with XRE-family HTH domain|uniref:Helix-turn-helix transcriptional regulator n=1 Tax=Citrobacter portucalensis TaxID=1639133 RepID=A0ABZ0H536_9ENTR|nr:helix-turn-helix transcriptional regulator [Citrobacter portucalensis]HEO9693179.1 helix-turn-helix transcriptional regulator [Klebsiella aerogenes]MDE9576522.1 helix-turn-helix domain-containing protein [Citrobacter portucalensis]MDE9649948.1 helix-turn-helix domain-containing protein [Citrobacter portucalensis]MEB2744151.1 helix-turn-helix transcriptional regulator [Citrobacter portucalensis]WOH44680.1 helix-turn-helix transcriptional regulator [Citrobacter portucalensis]
MDIKKEENREEDHKFQFGRRLAQAMLLTKHSNAALAKAIGVSEPMIKKYVDGKNLPKADVLQKISLVLGIDVSLLLDAQDSDGNREDKDLEFLNQTFKYLTVLQRKIILRQLSETVTNLLKLEENYLTKK